MGVKSVLRRYPRDVRFTPASGPPRVIAIRLKSANRRPEQVQQEKLLDHLVGGGEQALRHSETEYSCGLHVDDELELDGLHDRQVRGLSAL